ncbi:hypothetical protein [Micromonospora sp. NPDC005299]|uniref:YnfA family protein n=1 Tax=Micromonospora sp. NPDC005299 TaxID=3364231 RepID=UPI0036C106D4
MMVARSILLFLLAEIGGAWLVWQGWRENRGLLWIVAGVIALGFYVFVATFQPDPNFGRILAAYGGIFVAGSLAWGMVVDNQQVLMELLGHSQIGVTMNTYSHVMPTGLVPAAGATEDARWG